MLKDKIACLCNRIYHCSLYLLLHHESTVLDNVIEDRGRVQSNYCRHARRPFSGARRKCGLAPIHRGSWYHNDVMILPPSQKATCMFTSFNFLILDRISPKQKNCQLGSTLVFHIAEQIIWPEHRPDTIQTIHRAS